MSSLTGQSFALEHLSTTSLQHVAESRGLKSHQSRGSLLSSIKKDLTATLPFTWRTKTFAALPTALYGFSLVEYDGKLWLYGGRSGSSDPTEQYNTDFLCFDPQQGSWKVLDVSNSIQPPPRRWHAAVVHKDQMLVVGGQVFTGADWEPTSIMYSFSFESKQWSEVKQSGVTPCPKARFCCDMHDACIYVVPSESEGSRHLSSLTNVASFNLESKAWEARVCEGTNFNTRGIESVTSFGDYLYTLIADETNDKMQVYRLDTERNIWSFVDVAGDVPCCRRQCSAVRLQSSWLLCGGVSTVGEAQFVFSDCYNLDLMAMRWHHLIQIDPRLPTARASHSGVVLDNCAMFVGGWHQKWPGKIDNICIAKQFLEADESEAAPVPNTELANLMQTFRATPGAAALSDITLVSADGREFAAHKIVLASQSEVFDRMFQWSGSQESNSGRVLIRDVSGAALEAVLGYMYGGLPNIDPGLAIELFATSDKYGLDGLKMECILRMQGCLQDDTVALVAQLARLHDIQALWDACLEYTTRNPDRQASIFGSESYANLWQREPAIAQQFTSEAASRLAAKIQRMQSIGHIVFGGSEAKKHRTA